MLAETVAEPVGEGGAGTVWPDPGGTEPAACIVPMIQ